MAKKWHTRVTRDIVRSIQMGPLVVTGLVTGQTREIAPPRVHHLPVAGGTVTAHATKRDRDAFIAAINSEHFDAAVAA